MSMTTDEVLLTTKKFSERFSDCSNDECPADLASKNYIKFERIIPISAKDQDNVDSVKTAIRDVLDDYAERQLNVDDRLSRFLNEQSKSRIV